MHRQVLRAHSGFVTALRNSGASAALGEYPAGIPLLPQGVLADSIFFVDTGLVKITYVDCDGKEMILGVRCSGRVVGITATVLNQPQPAGAVTVTRCRLVRISAAEIRRLMSAESTFSRYVLELQAHEVHDHLRNVVELASHSTEYRLAKLLSDLVRGIHLSQPADGRTVQIPFKQWEIAELLTVSPEHTCRVFRRLQREGLVLRKGKTLLVPEPDKLLSYVNR